MKKKAIEWPLQTFMEENADAFIGVRTINMSLWMDQDEAEAITEFLLDPANRVKFIRIIQAMMQGQYPKALYRKEGHNEQTKHITAMKFKGGGLNTRIYCREYFLGLAGGGKKIVMISLLENKTSEKNDKKIRTLIESIAKYEYF